MKPTRSPVNKFMVSGIICLVLSVCLYCLSVYLYFSNLPLSHLASRVLPNNNLPSYKRDQQFDIENVSQSQNRVKKLHISPTIPHQHLTSCPEIDGSITNELLSKYTKNHHEKIEPMEWMQEVCPEVIKHVSIFPLFDLPDYVEGQNNTPPPLTSSMNGMQSICTMKIVNQLANKLGARNFLHAGSTLGALLHGGPIPWDDDVDMLLDFNFLKQFMDECAKHRFVSQTGVELPTLVCYIHRNAIKVNLVHSKTHNILNSNYSAPFVDLFLFKEKQYNGSKYIFEVNPSGTDRVEKYAYVDFFPIRSYYFGGLIFPGPSENVSFKRYKTSVCVVSGWNHRLELRYNEPKTHQIECCKMYRYFPFTHYYNTPEITYEMLIVDDQIRMINAFSNVDLTYRNNISEAAINTLLLPSNDPYTLDFAHKWWYIPNTVRETYKSMLGSVPGALLTKKIPNLDQVEVCNWESASEQCKTVRWDNFRVVEFNAERGKMWKDFVKVIHNTSTLQNADVIILNEMDIGMARSNNTHTARLLAHALDMNYAWAIEFVELTNGDQSEQKATMNETNQLGLHGNAILSKCPLKNCVVYRDTLDPSYYTKTPSSTNAKGFEIRLGGRGLLTCELWTPFENKVPPPIIGSIHKLSSPRHVLNIKQKLRNRKAIIAGDQHTSFCDRVSLEKHFNETVATWPASCTTRGRSRGDIMCSNVKRTSTNEESVIMPCWNNLPLSDHSIISNDYELFSI
eukprot:Pgem_evm1s14173